MTMLVLPSSSLARAFWMIASVRVSTLLVASSRMRMRGSVRTALAKESRALALAQCPTSFAQNRVVALGKGSDEVVGVYHAGRAYLLTRRLRGSPERP